MPAAAGKTMTTVLWGAAAAVWFGMMTWLSHQPGPGTSRTSRELAEELHSLLPGIKTESLNRLLRRTAHPVLFAGLAVLVGLALQSASCGAGLLPAGIAQLLWCWGDEATKRMVPGRHFSWLDVGLNAAGTLLGSGAVLLLG